MSQMSEANDKKYTHRDPGPMNEGLLSRVYRNREPILYWSAAAFVWGVNRSFCSVLKNQKTIIDNQIVIGTGLDQVLQGLDQIASTSATVRDVVKLAATGQN